MSEAELRQALRDSSLLMDEELDNIMQVIEEHTKQEIEKAVRIWVNTHET